LERPQNDNCAGATSLPNFVAETIVAGDTTSAYPGYSSVQCGVKDSERALWYSFVPETTGLYKATVRKYRFEAGLSLFSGSCDSLTCLVSRGYCKLFYSYCDISLSWNAVDGMNYYLLVHGTDSFSDAGPFEILVQVRIYFFYVREKPFHFLIFVTASRGDTDPVGPPTVGPPPVAPPPSTDDGNDDDQGDVCFSGSNTVVVRDQAKPVRMDSLNVGDYVQVGPEAYSEVYSFVHYDPHYQAAFLRITARTLGESADSDDGCCILEVTSKHLLAFADGSMRTAEHVALRTLLLGADHQPIEVTSISKVTRRGIYAPLTMQGTLLVGGVLASSYAALPHDDMQLFANHDLAHAFCAPRRMWCSMVTDCSGEVYVDGIPMWIRPGYNMLRVLYRGNWLLENVVTAGVLPIVYTLRTIEKMAGSVLLCRLGVTQERCVKLQN